MNKSPSIRPAEAGRVLVTAAVTNSPVFSELVALAPTCENGGDLIVRVLPDPDVLLPESPRIFQLFAVGLRAPPESPVIVLPAPVVERVTKPVAATAKLVESKLERPIFVASAAAKACEVCTLTVRVLTAPEVVTGDVPAAAIAPRIFQLLAVGDKAPPEFPVIVFPAPVVESVTKPVAATAKSVLEKLDSPIFVASAPAIA